MGANKDPNSNVKCRSVSHLAPSTVQMVAEQLWRVDARPSPAASASVHVVPPRPGHSLSQPRQLLRAVASQPRGSSESRRRGSWAGVQRGEVTHGNRLSEMLLHLLLSFLMPCSPGFAELGSWAACSVARPTAGLKAGTVAGLGELTQTKGPWVLQRAKKAPSCHRCGLSFTDIRCSVPDEAAVTYPSFQTH